MSSVKITDNTAEALSALESAVQRGLEIIGGKAETYAKELCVVDTGNLRNSITHQTDPAEKAVAIGSNVEYAPYVEMGTSRMKAQPYLRPAATEHTDVYKQIFESCFKDA